MFLLDKVNGFSFLRFHKYIKITLSSFASSGNVFPFTTFSHISIFPHIYLPHFFQYDLLVLSTTFEGLHSIYPNVILTSTTCSVSQNQDLLLSMLPSQHSVISFSWYSLINSIFFLISYLIIWFCFFPFSRHSVKYIFSG